MREPQKSQISNKIFTILVLHCDFGSDVFSRGIHAKAIAVRLFLLAVPCDLTLRSSGRPTVVPLPSLRTWGASVPLTSNAKLLMRKQGRTTRLGCGLNWWH